MKGSFNSVPMVLGSMCKKTIYVMGLKMGKWRSEAGQLTDQGCEVNCHAEWIGGKKRWSGGWLAQSPFGLAHQDRIWIQNFSHAYVLSFLVKEKHFEKADCSFQVSGVSCPLLHEIPGNSVMQFRKAARPCNPHQRPSCVNFSFQWKFHPESPRTWMFKENV